MQGVAAGALCMAESYPTSEVRGSSLECQAAMAQERLRGATRCPRPGTVAARSHPASEVGVAAGRSNPTPEASGGGWEEQPHIQRVVAAQAQEGLEKLFHVEGQEGLQ